jgi:deazaflavin-dependent oxidoreductase (nitroreductase family)
VATVAFNTQVIEEFRANEGRVGGVCEGEDLLLLHHVGAKSGERYVNPLAFHEDDGRWVIFASKAGAPTNPAWYWNLKAEPNVSIEVGTDRVDVFATEATGEERDRLFTAQKVHAPQFADYEKKTERIIPVIVLTPRHPNPRRDA